MPAPQRLRQLLQDEMDGTRTNTKPILLPCCYDGLSARLIAKAGFEATFMTGFGACVVLYDGTGMNDANDVIDGHYFYL
jgi:2-methylisocitrate lyase-like PEP mutase family enzyme